MDIDPNKEYLAAQIRTRMRKKYVTGLEVARATGLSKSCIHRAMRNASIELNNLIEIVDWLGGKLVIDWEPQLRDSAETALANWAAADRRRAGQLKRLATRRAREAKRESESSTPPESEKD